MIKKYLIKIKKGQNLTAEEAGELIDLMSTGEVFPSQIADLLVSLNTKEITSEELYGFARRMREKALTINTQGLENIVDSCGTGGDKTNTFNISTASAILVSAAGLNVAKHSNFGFTSKCGSSNVLQSLGIELLTNPQEVEKNLKDKNIAFIHAPYFHKCTSHVNAVRKELGIRTVFNLLGPLTNLAFPTGQVIGVPRKELCPKIAEALKNLGCKKAMVVNGLNPVMDEISICGKTFISRLDDGKIDNFEIHPEDFGIKQANLADIQGDTPDVNAKIIEDIFNGKISGAKLDIILLNSAALLWVGNAVNSIEEAIIIATDIIQSGRAKNKLNSLRVKY
ncbi:MAG TPA: anthranilate phosphoribosyltransferase [Cyanobacteria bacterium UBA9971]|nr:anthranilate phosphoribosyltransferase [Cyanobacteria bacterium UBA9971]